MTCIVGLLHKEKIFMGADSAGVGGYDLRIRIDSKIFKKDEFLIGFTSSFRMGQLLRYSFQIPPQKDNQDVFEYMVTDFVNAARDCFKQGGYAKISNNEETGGTFLIGYKKRLFFMESDFQIGECLEGYHAVGCGASYALGSIYSSDLLEPQERVLLALKASEAFNAGVRGPFRILDL